MRRAAKPITRNCPSAAPTSIKKYLIDKYGINGTDLVTVGYGKSKLKDANQPLAEANRRVQVVNMATQGRRQNKRQPTSVLRVLQEHPFGLIPNGGSVLVGMRICRCQPYPYRSKT